MAKHTKGPWKVLIEDTGGEFSGWPYIAPTDEELDCIIVHNKGFKDTYWDNLGLKESLANANLMAASPELLLALKDTMLTLAEVAKSTNTYEGLIDSPGWIRAMAAVNKAEGKK